MVSTTKAKVYVTRLLHNEAIDILKERFEVTAWEGAGPVPRSELLKNVRGKQGLLCLLTDTIDKDVLDEALDLRVISTLSVGYDHIDIKEIKERNIRIGHTPDVLTDATAELTIALLLATSRRLFEANHAARTGEDNLGCPLWMCGYGLSNATVGIVGFGRIGQEVAKLLTAFKVKQILYHGPSEKLEGREIGCKYASFETVCSESDFIIATCALTNQTRSLFNSKAFKMMKRSCIFINSSRGGVVDQDALVDALRTKTIQAAGLDVTTPEPLPTNHPLFHLPNCIVLPHIGSASVDARITMAKMAAENIKAVLLGQEMPAELKL